MVGEITYSPYSDGYAFLVHDIIEQMLSIKAGVKIYERLLALCGGYVTPTTINSLTLEDIRETLGSRLHYLYNNFQKSIF